MKNFSCKALNISALLFLTLVLVTNFMKNVSCQPQIRQISVLFRHGDRYPEITAQRHYNDPNVNISFYPFSSGDLTNDGKRRMYKFGQFLRDRYNDFLGPHYVENEIFTVSSEPQRTRMSLLLVLAALYPPSISDSQQWMDGLNWQPIPTDFLPIQKNILFNGEKCKEYIEEYGKVLNLPEVKEKFKEFEPFLEELRKRTGKSDNITELDLSIIHNNFIIERQLNMTMDPWMIKCLEERDLFNLRQLYFALYSYNDRLKRLQGGVLLRKLYESIRAKINSGLDDKTKILLYSGHDRGIIGMLQALNLFYPHIPSFGSAIIFELLFENNAHHIKVLYYLGDGTSVKELEIKNCGILCPVEKFFAFTDKVRASDSDLQCEINSTNYFDD